MVVESDGGVPSAGPTLVRNRWTARLVLSCVEPCWRNETDAELRLTDADRVLAQGGVGAAGVGLVYSAVV